MSICASIFVLFRDAPSEVRISQLDEMISNRIGRPVEVDGDYFRLLMVDDADLLIDVSDDGELQYLSRRRCSALVGVPLIQGRLFQISYLTRWWSEDYSQGPMIDYALTMLCLLSQQNVQAVWYTDDSYSDGVVLQAMNHSKVHELIDKFVAVGETFGGRPVRYVRCDSGLVINV